MASSESTVNVLLDLNNPTFQENLFGLQKPEKLAALDTLKKIASSIGHRYIGITDSSGKKSSAFDLRKALMRSIRCVLRNLEEQRHTEMDPSCVY